MIFSDDMEIYTKPIPEGELQTFADRWNRANHFPVGENTEAENMRVDAPNNICWNSYDSPSIDLSEFVVLALLSSPTLLAKVKRALNV